MPCCTFADALAVSQVLKEQSDTSPALTGEQASPPKTPKESHSSLNEARAKTPAKNAKESPSMEKKGSKGGKGGGRQKTPSKSSLESPPKVEEEKKANILPPPPKPVPGEKDYVFVKEPEDKVSVKT